MKNRTSPRNYNVLLKACGQQFTVGMLAQQRALTARPTQPVAQARPTTVSNQNKKKKKKAEKKKSGAASTAPTEPSTSTAT